MIKLICEKCGRVWYTANTNPNQRCSICHGKLIEADICEDYSKDKADLKEKDN